jgi:hypothetical protein
MGHGRYSPPHTLFLRFLARAVPLIPLQGFETSGEMPQQWRSIDDMVAVQAGTFYFSLRAKKNSLVLEKGLNRLVSMLAFFCV